MTLQEIIIEYKRKFNSTNEEIAERVGVNKSTVSRWISGDVRKASVETAEKISEMVGFDITPILKGTAVNYRKPILGIAKAGYNYLAEENYLGFEEVTEADNRNGDYFLKITGNSMDQAKIHDGDLVFVRSCKDVNSGDIAVVLIGHEEVTVKRVIKKAGMIILEAANPEVENRYYSKEEVRTLPVEVIGKVLYSRTEF